MCIRSTNKKLHVSVHVQQSPCTFVPDVDRLQRIRMVQSTNSLGDEWKRTVQGTNSLGYK